MKLQIAILFAAFCLTAVGQVPDYVPADGLVAWYPFNGNAADESGNGNDGVGVEVEAVEDRFGHSNAAFFFSSAGCQPRVDAQIDMTSVQSEMTFSFWMSRSGDGCISPRILEILGSDGAYLQASVSDNSLSFGFDGGIGAPEPIQSNTWYHMLITIDDTGFCAFYQNGALVDSGVITPTGIPMDVSKLNGDIAIGRMNHSAWDAFRGVIDDVALWNRVLHPGEIQALYNSEAVSEVPEYVSNDGLVAWYSFDSNLDDSGPNNHDGQSDSFGFGEDAVGEAESSLRLELGEFVSLGMEDKLLNNGEDTLSISFWSKPDQGAFTTVSKYVNFEPEQSSWMVFDIESSGVRALGNGFDGNDVTWFSNCPNVTSEWSHVTAIYTPGKVSLWINGEFTCETNVPISNVTDAQPILVGRSNCDGDNCNDASGLIDNLGFWDRALTLEEIQALFDTEPIEQASQYVPDSVLVSEGWTLVLEREGHQYWLFDEDREWEEARAMCEALGAYLYWPNSLEEHEAVWESVPKGNDDIHYWTAIHQDFSVVDCSDPNGGWAGPNGEPQTFFLWEQYEPSDANNKESVVQFEWDSQGIQWNDAPGQACDDGNNCACRFSRVILERANDLGCTDASACNYDEAASLDDGSCDYSCCPGPGCCHAGTVWDVALQQCVVAEPAYLNEPGEAAVLNPCYFDSDDDGLVDVNDLMNLLTVYNLACGDAPETTASWQCGDPLEYQGYDYATVQIGTQCWFAENARYMPEVAPAAQAKSTPEAPLAFVYGYQGTDTLSAQAEENYQIFGALYNFEAVSSWNLCPSGWHVPSDEDWFVLDEFIGLPFDDVVVVGWRGTQEGASLKSEYAWDGTDDWGFNALPGGRVNLRQWSSEASYFGDIGQLAHFWTSGSVVAPEIDGWGEIQAFNRYLNGDEDRYGRGDYALGFGMSVRCVKDSE